MSDLVKDIRFGLRMLARHKMVTAISLITLGLGIGASTAVFSVVDATLLSPLPFPDAQRLVWISASKPAAGWFGMTISYPNFTDWSEQCASLESTGIFGHDAISVRGSEHPDRLPAIRAAAGVLEVLQVRPVVGRRHEASHDHPEADRVVLLSEDIWRERFAAAPDVVGQTLDIDEVPHRIIGVLPKEVSLAVGRFDVWLPFTYGGVKENRGNRHYHGIGRLRSGASIDQANRELATIADRLAELYPEPNRGYSVFAKGLTEVRRGPTATSVMIVLSAAMGFVLLIACVNIANLLLSTAGSREREFAVRTALGAGPRRLLRQLMTESLLLAAGGGLVGVAIAFWSVDVLAASLETTVRFIGEVGVDARALAFTCLVLVATTIGFGLPVARRVSGEGFSRIMSSASRAGFGTRRDRVRREILVVVQVALALSLMISAALMIRSLMNLKTVDPGFDTDRLLTLRIKLPAQSYPSDEQKVTVFDDSIRQIAAVPGVRSVSATSTLPLTGSNANTGMSIEDHPISDPADLVFVGAEVVAPGFLETMGIPLVEGRGFTAADRADAAPVVIINRHMARHFWPSESALGKRVKYGRLDSASPWLEVVGVMGDHRQTSLEVEPRFETLSPAALSPSSAMTFVVRTDGDPAAAVAEVQNAIWRVGPDLAIYEVDTMADVVARNTRSLDDLTTLLLGFGLVALVLALGGLYGVMSFSVGSQTKEIGLRMALGAETPAILRAVLQRSALLILVGMAIGSGIALMLSRSLRDMLFGIEAFDPVVYLAVAGGMLWVGLVAGFIPAMKASRVDPVIALRHE